MSVWLAMGLAAVSVLLAGPVSSRLAAAGWARGHPRPSLVLWQAVCLAAGLLMIEAGLIVAVAPLGRCLGDGLLQWTANVRAGVPLAGMTSVGVVTGVLALLAALVLLITLLRSMAWAQRRRRTHRTVLDLLTSGQPQDQGRLLRDVRVIEDRRAVAYSVPGWHARVVLSGGMLDLLQPDELRAVIAHERAHVRFRHDLLVLPFQAWATTLGRVPGVRRAAEAVTELAEMLADDVAARHSSRRVVAAALVKVALAGAIPAPVGASDPTRPTRPKAPARSAAAGPVPGVGSAPARAADPCAAGELPGNPAATPGSVVRRVRRLCRPGPRRWPAALIWLAAVAVVSLPLLVAVVVRWR